ncbi:MAG: DUF134 domain-containing protein [Calditrichia bacterium]|nr:DUF134 domain-containing protein [Calditrichia bacterium]
MRGPYRKRLVQKPPQFKNFKPSGIPRKMLKKIELTLDEYEAIRLADYLKLEHLESSQKMKISRPTFTRLIDRARQKVASAIIDGMELIIEGGNVDLENTFNQCRDCGDIQETPISKQNENCPDCGSENIDDLSQNFINKKDNLN